MVFIDELRAAGHAVESICRVLRQQGCQIAARTYRDWTRTNRPVAVRTITDAMVTNQIRDLAWSVGLAGVRRMTPEGLYGRGKMTALVQRTSLEAHPDLSIGRCDPCPCKWFDARRASGRRSPARTASGPVTSSIGTSPPSRRTGPG